MTIIRGPDLEICDRQSVTTIIIVIIVINIMIIIIIDDNAHYDQRQSTPITMNLLLVLDHLLKGLSDHFHCDKLKFHLHKTFLIVNLKQS